MVWSPLEKGESEEVSKRNDVVRREAKKTHVVVGVSHVGMIRREVRRVGTGRNERTSLDVVTVKGEGEEEREPPSRIDQEKNSPAWKDEDRNIEADVLVGDLRRIKEDTFS